MSLPEDGYLLAVGQFAYMVTAIEGTLIFDLPRLQAHLPEGHTPEDLAGRTTTKIGKRLGDMVPGITDPQVAAYYEFGARVLVRVGEARNAVLHARPATIEGRQRLYRWRRGERPEAFAVTLEWITQQIHELSTAAAELNELRPPLEGEALAKVP